MFYLVGKIRQFSTFLRLYVVAALIVTTILSPLAFSAVPVLVIAWYVYQWRRTLSPAVAMLSVWFVFFALNLMLSRPLGIVPAILISLPVLVLLLAEMDANARTARANPAAFRSRSRQPTPTAAALGILSVILLILALIVGSLSLMAASLIIIALMAGLAVVAWRALKSKPVQETPLQYRIVAGSSASLEVEMKKTPGVAGRLFLQSPYEWLTIQPSAFTLDSQPVKATIRLSPGLSGPSTVMLSACAFDGLGLVQRSFDVELLSLYVIPRARYAAWLAEHYIAGSRPGALPMVSNVGTMNPTQGWRQGVEYYGTRSYQPGDSLKDVDWKHSLQHGELTAKELADSRGRPAIILINLTVGNHEEADETAYDIMTTALSLARENIPGVIAAYNHREPKVVTGLLGSTDLLAASLRVAKGMVTVVSPTRYLGRADVSRLVADIHRLNSVRGHAASTLAELLRTEYRIASRASIDSPASRALSLAFGKVDSQANVVVISRRNHDAEALSLATLRLRQKGNQVINVDVHMIPSVSHSPAKL